MSRNRTPPPPAGLILDTGLIVAPASVLARYGRTGIDLTWRCPGCGHRYHGGLKECLSCNMDTITTHAELIAAERAFA